MESIYDIKEWRKLRQVKFEWGHRGYEVVVGEVKVRGGKIELLNEIISASVLSRLEKGEYTYKYTQRTLYIYEGSRRIHHQTGRPYYGIEYEINTRVGTEEFIKTLDNIGYTTHYTEPTGTEEVIETTYKDIPSGKRFEVVPYGWSGTVLGTNEDGSILVYLKEINITIIKDKKTRVTVVYREEPKVVGYG